MQARTDLGRWWVRGLSDGAQSARGIHQPAVPQRRIDECSTITERFMTRWHGDPDPAHVQAVDAYWVSAAEHGLNASTFTTRVIASTNSDLVSAIVGAVGALKGPLHGGAPGPAMEMVFESGKADRAEEVLRRKAE